MGGELGHETYIDVLLVSSPLFRPNFMLIENNFFLYENVFIKILFSSLRGYLGEIESIKIEIRIPFFIYTCCCQKHWYVRVSVSYVRSLIRSG